MMKNLEPSYNTSNSDTKISWKLNFSSGGLFTVGYAAKGVLYAVLGILCISSAFGPGGSDLSLQESLRWLKEKPFGTILLAVVGLGVVAYALYRVGCAVFDLEDVGHDGKGIGKRLGFTASALTYFGLAITAFNLVATGNDEGSSPGRYISDLMSSIWGTILLGLVATGMLIAAFAQATKAITGSFKERYHIDDLPSKVSKFVGLSGFLGLSARAYIFATLSLFLLYALLTRDSSQAESMSGALQWLDSSTAGPWVLATVGIGFTAYGIYAAALSRYGAIHRN